MSRVRFGVVAALAAALIPIGAAVGPALAGASTTRPVVAHSARISGLRFDGTVQSNNWSGYDEGTLDTGTPFTSISGQWTIPTATQHTAGQAESAANWVGIGGGCVNMTSGCSVTDPTLIQAGTEEDVSATGQASYSAWWEILPVPSVTASITVHPGDVVTVSITGPVLFTMQLNDVTDGQSFTQTVPYASTMDSAEWIEEAPVVVSVGSGTAAGEASLPNLTAPVFDHATVNGAPAALTSPYEIQMVSASGSVLATPSAPDRDADGFDVCTYRTTCTAPAS